MQGTDLLTKTLHSHRRKRTECIGRLQNRRCLNLHSITDRKKQTIFQHFLNSRLKSQMA